MKKRICTLILALLLSPALWGQKAPEWKLGSSIGIMEPNVEELMKAAKNNGFEYVEAVISWYMHTDIAEIVRQVAEYKKLADKYGLTIWSVHLPFGAKFDLSTLDPVARERCKQYLIVSFELAKGFGTYHKAILHTSAEPVIPEEREARIKILHETLKEFGPYVEGRYHVRIAVENLPRTCLGNTSVEMLAILGDIPQVDMCFDVNHLLLEKSEEMGTNLGKHIQTLHISDYDQIAERHWLPGKGIINWNKVIDGLVKNRFEGPFMFEVRLIDQYKGDPELYFSDMAKSWNKIKSDYGKYKY
jgi:sugar phosphate isomerase/epimerase